MRQAKIFSKQPTQTMVEKSASELNSVAIKVKGYQLGLVTGSNDTQLQLPKEAATFLGIAFNQNLGGDFTLRVNNETVHEKIDSSFAVPMPLGALSLQPYFPVNRKVFGNDEIKLSINATAALNANMIVYYK